MRNLSEDARGYKIFYTIQQREEGTYNFLAIVPERVAECAVHHLCGICGKPLDYWIYFVGGEISCLQTRVFPEPPMHKECVEYAVQVCPFLVNPHYRRIEERSDRPADAHKSPGGVESDGARWAIYKTREYKAALVKGTVMFLAAPARSIEWIERKQ